jgi:hypothetical protein
MIIFTPFYGLLLLKGKVRKFMFRCQKNCNRTDKNDREVHSQFTPKNS